MKYAADFRREARESLKGKWLYAVLAGIITSILGAGTSSGGINLNIDLSENTLNSEGGTMDSIGSMFQAGGLLVGILSVVGIVAVIFSIAFFVLGSIIDLGYARFNLDLVDKKPVTIGSLFSYFPRWKTALAARLLQTVYVFLWTLLFIIPGIIAAYRYSMTSYIIAEDPEIKAGEAITKSKEMMKGNKGRLFCLEISFIGWSFLCVFSCGIGYLWLMPYMQAAFAAFYREVSGTGAVDPILIDGVAVENSEGESL